MMISVGVSHYGRGIMIVTKGLVGIASMLGVLLCVLYPSAVTPPTPVLVDPPASNLLNKPATTLKPTDVSNNTDSSDTKVTPPSPPPNDDPVYQKLKQMFEANLHSQASDIIPRPDQVPPSDPPVTSDEPSMPARQTPSTSSHSPKLTEQEWLAVEHLVAAARLLQSANPTQQGQEDGERARLRDEVVQRLRDDVVRLLK